MDKRNELMEWVKMEGLNVIINRNATTRVRQSFCTLETVLHESQTIEIQLNASVTLLRYYHQLNIII